jgi:glutamate synthase (NADPH) large chain
MENRLLYKNVQPKRIVLSSEIADQEALQELLQQPSHGACGVAAFQSATGASRKAVELLLRQLCAHENRAGVVVDERGHKVGDGAGAIFRTNNDEAGNGMQEYMHSNAGREHNVPLSYKGEQLHGSLLFLPKELADKQDEVATAIQRILNNHGFHFLNFQKARTNPDAISKRSQAVMPDVYQLTYAEGQHESRETLQKAIYLARLAIQKTIPQVHIVSLQPGTMTWKAMCVGAELPEFYPDLMRPDFITDAGTSHTRFSTNTAAEWDKAQGFDFLVHNGEVNTNRKIMRVLRNMERKGKLPTNIIKGGSDSSNLDRAFQFLRYKGLSLAEAVRFMVYPALDDLETMPPDIKEYFIALAQCMGSFQAIGPITGFVIDRDIIVGFRDNSGLRPLVVQQIAGVGTIMGSAINLSEEDRANVVSYHRPGPGAMVTLNNRCHFANTHEATRAVVKGSKLMGEKQVSKVNHPRRRNRRLTVAGRQRAHLDRAREIMAANPNTRIRRLHTFGANRQRLKQLRLSIEAEKDPLDGMGSDLAPACFSEEPNSLGRYLIANNSQVSNPSLDYIREDGTFTLRTFLGARPQGVLENELKVDPKYNLTDPLLDDDQMTALYATNNSPESSNPHVQTISTTFSPQTAEACMARIDEIKGQILDHSNGHHAIVVLSDRDTSETEVYIPPHLLVSYLSEALDDAGKSSGVSLVVDTGEVLDQHEFNTLVACGAKAVHPRLIYQELNADTEKKKKTLTPKGSDLKAAKKALRASFSQTLLRYIAKLGITNIDGYRGARSFCTLGLDTTLVEKYFTDEVNSNGGGVTLDQIIEDQSRRAAIKDPNDNPRFSLESHAYNTEVWQRLQEAGGGIAHPKRSDGAPELYKITDPLSEEPPAETGTDSIEITEAERARYQAYQTAVNKTKHRTFRGSFRFKQDRTPIDISEVPSTREIISELIQGGARSVGSVNDMSHKAFDAIFNLLGSQANSGEGGVPADRRIGERWAVSGCRGVQVASGRFGVDIDYLANPQVESIQIKIGQGAKPGVGGHLPGRKTTPNIARNRGVAPGQELISPPTNHDIYSIEDLQALIDQLSACNPLAAIGPKITAGNNVGLIAAGCVKTHADFVQISGAEGGTGAATQTDKHNTGLPVEFGVAYAHQQLVLQGLRDYAQIGGDGGLKTGHDIAQLISLGADFVEIVTPILIAQQKCTFCNKCSTQTCPAHITRTVSELLGSSRDKVREGYTSDEEWNQFQRLVYNGLRILELMAEEIQGIMARLGIRTIEELHGNRDLLELDPEALEKHPWLSNFNSDIFLETPRSAFETTPKTEVEEKEGDPNTIDYYLDHPSVNQVNKNILIAVQAGLRIEQNPIIVDLLSSPLNTEDRHIGATLGFLISRGVINPPSNGIIIKTTGTSGQKYATGITDGVTIVHSGDIQNEVASFQNGGRIVVKSPIEGSNREHIIGNTGAYGATGGERFLQGSVGERFCARESGGSTIISGHTNKFFAAYKSGGLDIVLGELGNQVGKGMSGGEIYTMDQEAVDKLGKNVEVTGIIRQSDLDKVRKHLEEFYRETGDPETRVILDSPGNWMPGTTRFKKIVATGQYGTYLFQYFHAQFYKLKFNPTQLQEELSAQLLEMIGYDIVNPLSRAKQAAIEADIQHALDQLPIHIEALNDVSRNGLSAEQTFVAINEYSKEIVRQIREKFQK